jgi:hypothetical protein
VRNLLKSLLFLKIKQNEIVIKIDALITSSPAKISVLYMGFKLVAEPHRFRRVESRQKIPQVLNNDVPAN